MAHLFTGTERKEIAPGQGDAFTPEELHALIADHLEPIVLPDGMVMLVDKEGPMKQLAPNQEAMAFAGEHVRPDDSLVGPVLVLTVRELGLDEQDQQDLETFRRQLQPIEHQIARLEGKQRDPYLDAVAGTFHLGMVGGSGRRTARLNARKERALDKHIETAKKLEPLYRERARLLGLISAITSGKRRQQREAEARHAQRRREAEARIRAARPGDYVIDSAFGRVKVVRCNQKSLTIETESGYRERRPFNLIRDVYRPKPEARETSQHANAPADA